MTSKKNPQFYRDLWACVAVSFLAASGLYIFIADAKDIPLWGMEVALVSSILSETYAKD